MRRSCCQCFTSGYFSSVINSNKKKEIPNSNEEVFQSELEEVGSRISIAFFPDEVVNQIRIINRDERNITHDRWTAGQIQSRKPKGHYHEQSGRNEIQKIHAERSRQYQQYSQDELAEECWANTKDRQQTQSQMFCLNGSSARQEKKATTVVLNIRPSDSPIQQQESSAAVKWMEKIEKKKTQRVFF